MVRIALDACVSDLVSPTDIYQNTDSKRLLVRKGVPLTKKTLELLQRNDIQFLDFPLPFENETPPPYTFEEETELALFRLAHQTFLAFKNSSVKNPLDIRKEAYEILGQAFKEFQRFVALEEPVGEITPKRHPRSVLHLRTIGSVEDYLYEHAKNVALACVAMGFDFFKGSKQLLSEIHKVAVAGLFADIGMMRIPLRILKAEKLEEADWKKIHEHPVHSAEFVESLFRQKEFITAKIVLQHHERMDRSGYPNGSGPIDQSPHAHLLAVIDSYCGLVSKRYFRTAKNPIEGLLSINQAVGKQYDKLAVRCLNYRIAPYPIGTVANFAGMRLVQVQDLKNLAIGVEVVPVYTPVMKNQLYNLPNHIRAFSVEANSPLKKAVPVEGHLDKMGIPLDSFDLVKLYGFTKSKG
ncbi:MAG: HD domain-containing protein [bacterium]|nr:HD domain-containing protein [bacterium]